MAKTWTPEKRAEQRTKIREAWMRGACDGRVPRGSTEAERLRETRKKLRAEGRCTECWQVSDRPGKYRCRSCQDKYNGWARRHHHALRLRVLLHYSGGDRLRCCCAGCSFTEQVPDFYDLDHIANGGHSHKLSLGYEGGLSYWGWLVKNDFPPGFQTLCATCNVGKERNGGVCPHVSVGQAAPPENARSSLFGPNTSPATTMARIGVNP